MSRIIANRRYFYFENNIVSSPAFFNNASMPCIQYTMPPIESGQRALFFSHASRMTICHAPRWSGGMPAWWRPSDGHCEQTILFHGMRDRQIICCIDGVSCGLDRHDDPLGIQRIHVRWRSTDSSEPRRGWTTFPATRREISSLSIPYYAGLILFYAYMLR